jgi:DNA-binding LacI/PurR family transcriptional regulator
MTGLDDTPSPRPPTLYDVARVVGVSHQTVSRVVKGHPNVRKDVRERIEAAIAELNYKPNLVARSLATSKSHRIGALVYELLASGPSKIMEGASIRAREAGYLLDIVSLDPENDGGISEAIDLMAQSNLAGLLAFTPTDRVVHALKQASFSVPVSLESETSMWNDDGELTMGESGVELMVDHLVSLGHTRFFHISGPPGWLAARGRSNAYESALAAHGLTSVGTMPGDWSAAAGFAAAMALPLDAGITALVAANDQTALGAISALESRGVSIPRDMSVVGFDDIPESQFFRPPLTTVRFAFAEQGRIAIDRLLARIDGRAPEVTETGPPALVVRSSSGPVPSR